MQFSKRVSTRFWAWYEKFYRVNLLITAGLFLLQIVHLYWLTTHVVAHRLFGESLFNPNDFWSLILALVDYTEIPALILADILYVRSLRKKKNVKDVMYLVFLNIQFIHIFWITDEVVLEIFGHGRQWRSFVAWVAILIDYLELPVIFETIQKMSREYLPKSGLSITKTK